MLAHERKKGRIQTIVPHALMNGYPHGHHVHESWWPWAMPTVWITGAVMMALRPAAIDPALSAPLFLFHPNSMRATMLRGNTFMRVGGTDDLSH